VNAFNRPFYAALVRRTALLGAAGLIAACGGHNGPQDAPAQGLALAAPNQDASWMELQCDDSLGSMPGVIPVKVSGGTERDHGFACAAMRRAVGFFAGHGLTPDLRLRIEFKESVFIDLPGPIQMAGTDQTPSNTDTTAVAVDAAGRSFQRPLAHAEQILGMFHRGSRSVLMTTEASPWIRSYAYFGSPVTDEMFTALLTHEITHALSKSLYAPSLLEPDTDIHVQEEYVAYVSQLSTMDARLRADVLARFPASEYRFTGEADINALLLGLSPEAFGVTSYRHFVADGGGSDFLRRLYGGDFRPPQWPNYIY
jgi:hypothetical protein